jgi:hypothetical protein
MPKKKHKPEEIVAQRSGRSRGLYREPGAIVTAPPGSALI